MLSRALERSGASDARRRPSVTEHSSNQVTIKADTRTLHFHRVAAYKRLTAAVCSAARGRGDQPLKERALLLLKLALNALLELAQAAVEARRERLRVCGVVE